MRPCAKRPPSNSTSAIPAHLNIGARRVGRRSAIPPPAMISRASDAMTDDATRANPKPPPVDRMSLLWRRLNEHKIVQWSVAYVALAYAIQHAIILTSESYEWPNIVARVSMTLLVLVLPLVMLLAWYHGHHASRSVSKAEASIIALLLAASSLWFYT